MKKKPKFQIIINWNDCPGHKGWDYFVLERRKGYVQHYPEQDDRHTYREEAVKSARNMLARIKRGNFDGINPFTVLPKRKRKTKRVK